MNHLILIQIGFEYKYYGTPPRPDLARKILGHFFLYIFYNQATGLIGFGLLNPTPSVDVKNMS